MARLEDITEEVIKYNPEADIDLIWKAYVYSAKVHSGQVRASGEPYLSHPIDVSFLVTRFKMDTVSIVVGLLHDTIEDTYSTEDEIRELFGEEVLFLVNGLTKISRIEFSSEEEKQAENYRKMILAMSQDIRVIVIKLCDRLHNMRTLHFTPPEKQVRVARETLDIYAPVANRLGIAWMKQELEDLALQFLCPEEYLELKKSVETHYGERTAYINEVVQEVIKNLEETDIDAEVEGRPKHFYSIYKKMVRKKIAFEQVYDLIGIRILTLNLKDCYSALGTIHHLWKPIPGKIKDYIAIPKRNMYQSLHTTVIGPSGHRVEFQIRTGEMHKVAEDGIAAHWKYKEQKKDGKASFANPDQKFSWLKDMLEFHSDLQNPREFIERMRIDLFPDEVYVFTPRGDVKAFPKGATPLDFAYSIHTDVGHHAVGAKVNGKQVSLKYHLKNGEIVEISTSNTAKPKRDWVKLVKTTRARAKISIFLREELKERSINLGREMLEKELKKRHLNPDAYLKSPEIIKIAKKLDFSSDENLFAAIGFGKYSVNHMLAKVVPRAISENDNDKGRAENGKEAKRPVSTDHVVEGIKISGIDDVLIRFAKCCSPLPGDDIIGYISVGKGVTVHSADCVNADNLVYDDDRRVDVEWDRKTSTSHKVKITVHVENKPGMLSKISNAIAEKKVNICDVMTVKEKDDTLIHFSIEVSNIKQLQGVINSIKSVEEVRSVERIKGVYHPGKGFSKRLKKGFAQK